VRLEPPRVPRAVGGLPHGYSRFGLSKGAVQTGKRSPHTEIGQGGRSGSHASERPDRRLACSRVPTSRMRLLFSKAPDSFAPPPSRVIHITP
jgi:hypothetical protein